jgi:hypothetical protein
MGSVLVTAGVAVRSTGAESEKGVGVEVIVGVALGVAVGLAVCVAVGVELTAGFDDAIPSPANGETTGGVRADVVAAADETEKEIVGANVGSVKIDGGALLSNMAHIRSSRTTLHDKPKAIHLLFLTPLL